MDSNTDSQHCASRSAPASPLGTCSYPRPTRQALFIHVPGLTLAASRGCRAAHGPRCAHAQTWHPHHHDRAQAGRQTWRWECASPPHRLAGAVKMRLARQRERPPQRRPPQGPGQNAGRQPAAPHRLQLLELPEHLGGQRGPVERCLREQPADRSSCQLLMRITLLEAVPNSERCEHGRRVWQSHST